MLIDNCRAGWRRRVIHPAGAGHQPRHGLDEQILAGQCAFRTLLPVPRDRGINEPWIDLAQRLIVEPEAIDDSRPEILNQHVRARGEAARHLLRLRAFEVERDAAHVAMRQQEEWADPVQEVVASAPGPLPGAPRRLDFDDVRAQVRQVLHPSGSKEELGQAQDLDSGQGVHGVALSLCFASSRFDLGTSDSIRVCHSPRAWIKPVADAITKEVERDDDGEDGQTREAGDPPLVDQEAASSPPSIPTPEWAVAPPARESSIRRR